MHLRFQDIDQLDHVYRLNLINGITGYKPANLIGTKSKDGVSNLAIISSVVHLGSNPPLVGYILRPTTVPRHTHENILNTNTYTINHIHSDFVERAHYTSAKFDKGVSEFDKCNFTEEYIDGFSAPYVKESAIKLGMSYVEQVHIKANNTMLIIGKIEHIIIPDECVLEDGKPDLNHVNDVCISGLNNYHQVKEIASFPYARVNEVPDFGA